MYIFHLLRSFTPIHNPIGFGAADFIEIVLAALLVWMTLAWPSWIAERARGFAEKTLPCMLLLAILPIVLRLLLLKHYPIPTPDVSDDFSYVLLADTLRHFRFANPPLPLSQFFETFFVLQQPTYSSIYPLGQGIALALGWTIFGHPWAGVALSIAALCALCYWMLRAWISPGWSLIGGLLAVFLFGPLSQWMNSYWGGAISAIAGCLVFGALSRLAKKRRLRDAGLLGAGLGIQLLTRPFEFVFVLLSAALFFAPWLWKQRFPPVRIVARLAVVALLAFIPAVALTLAQNKQVTGQWLTLPYMLSRYQYGVPATLTIQPMPVPHRELTPQQRLDYEIQSSVHGKGPETIQSYLGRLAARVRFYRFFFYAPLYIAILLFLIRVREFRFAWVVLTLLIFALGSNFYPYFYSHYIAAAACLFILVSVAGLERLSRVSIRERPTGYEAARVIVFLCAAQFLFWYGIHALGDEEIAAAATRYETWDAINHGDPDGRLAVNAALARAPGKQLVFVRYWQRHLLREWVNNAADIRNARIVWARDLGREEDQKLADLLPDRTVWLLQPDAHPPSLTRIF